MVIQKIPTQQYQKTHILSPMPCPNVIPKGGAFDKAAIENELGIKLNERDCAYIEYLMNELADSEVVYIGHYAFT